MLKDHDLHLWLDAEEYAWLCRQAREQDRSKNAIIRRLIRQARAESMDDDEECTRDELGRAMTPVIKTLSRREAAQAAIRAALTAGPVLPHWYVRAGEAWPRPASLAGHQPAVWGMQ